MIVVLESSESTIADSDDGFAALTDELGERESLGLGELGRSQPGRIREFAERHHANFRPAVERAEEDPRAFQTASDLGLSRLAEMGKAADNMDNLGDRWANESLTRVESAPRTES